MPDQVRDRLVNLLTSRDVHFQLMSHEPAYTSAESAAVRGVSLHTGAKALVLKAEDSYLMIVLPADFALDSKGAKRELGCKRLRFADANEVNSLTGLKPGAIPPFGSLFGLSTLCDERLSENETIYFNAGSHSVSIGMRYLDYLSVENPRLGMFGQFARERSNGEGKNEHPTKNQ